MIGGGTGVGRGIALSLAAAGAVVAVLGRTESTLRETCEAIEVQGGKALTVVSDVRELGIRVNTIVPLASSPGFERWREQDPDGYDAVLESIPLRALPDARDDVGAAVVYLASDDARMITGTTLTVDGGSTHLR